MELTIFGIKNCDTMKKAMNWLDENGIDYHFHDYKKEGVPEQRLRQWLEALLTLRSGLRQRPNVIPPGTRHGWHSGCWMISDVRCWVRLLWSCPPILKNIGIKD